MPDFIAGATYRGRVGELLAADLKLTKISHRWNVTPFLKRAFADIQ